MMSPDELSPRPGLAMARGRSRLGQRSRPRDLSLVFTILCVSSSLSLSPSCLLPFRLPLLAAVAECYYRCC